MFWYEMPYNLTLKMRSKCFIQSVGINSIAVKIKYIPDNETNEKRRTNTKHSLVLCVCVHTFVCGTITHFSNLILLHNIYDRRHLFPFNGVLNTMHAENILQNTCEWYLNRLYTFPIALCIQEVSVAAESNIEFEN